MTETRQNAETAPRPTLEDKPLKAKSPSFTAEFLDVACKINLFFSSMGSLLLTRAIFSPTAMSFLVGWTASEYVHFLSFFQAVNLLLLNFLHPTMFIDSFFAKFMLIVNFYSFAKQSQALKELLGSKNDFSFALENARIPVRSGSSKALFIASLMPLWAIGRRGKKLQRTTLSYSPIEVLDSSLVDNWQRMPKNLRLIQAYIGRDAAMNWMSLDVLTLDSLPPPGAPVLMYIHGKQQHNAVFPLS
jgi:hypothetical protein